MQEKVFIKRPESTIYRASLKRPQALGEPLIYLCSSQIEENLTYHQPSARAAHLSSTDERRSP